MGKNIPSWVIDELKFSVPISRVFQMIHGVILEPCGKDEYKTKCVFHKEDTPSLFINDRLNCYHCFGCGAKGDVYSLIEDKFNCRNFVETIQHFALITNQYDKVLPHVEKPIHLDQIRTKYIKYTLDTAKEKQQEHAVQSSQKRVETSKVEHMSLVQLHGLNKEIYRFACESAFQTNAKQYLQSRNITRLSDEDSKKIGFIPFLVDPGKNFGYLYSFLKGVYIFESNGKKISNLYGRIYLPVFSLVNQDICGFSARLVNPKYEERGFPKYIISTGINKTESVLTLSLTDAITRAKEKNIVIVTEGAFDLLALWQMDVTNVVASMGTCINTPLLLKTFATKNVGLFYDNDVAGFLGVYRTFKSLFDEKINNADKQLLREARFFLLPLEKKDIHEQYCTATKNDLQNDFYNKGIMFSYQNPSGFFVYAQQFIEKNPQLKEKYPKVYHEILGTLEKVKNIMEKKQIEKNVETKSADFK